VTFFFVFVFKFRINTFIYKRIKEYIIKYKNEKYYLIYKLNNKNFSIRKKE